MLPGQIEKLRHSVDEGCCHEGCTNHPTHKRCTESDSFGDEVEYYCDEHIEVVRKEMAEAPEVEENCEWCGKLAVLRPHRDWEEGTGGPCYDLCSECIGKNIQSGIDDHAMILDREDAEEDDHYEEDEELDPIDESRDQWYMGNWVPAEDFNIGLDHIFKFSISGPRLVKQESAFGDHIVFTAHFRTGNVRVDLQLKHDSLIIYGERRIVSFEKAMAVANKIRAMGYPVKRAGSEEEVEPQPVARQAPRRSAGESELGLRPLIIDASFLMAMEKVDIESPIFGSTEFKPAMKNIPVVDKDGNPHNGPVMSSEPSLEELYEQVRPILQDIVDSGIEGSLTQFAKKFLAGEELTAADLPVMTSEEMLNFLVAVHANNSPDPMRALMYYVLSSGVQKHRAQMPDIYREDGSVDLFAVASRTRPLVGRRVVDESLSLTGRKVDEQELLKNAVVDTFKPGVSDLNGDYFKPPQTPEEGHDLSGDVNEFCQNHPDFD